MALQNQAPFRADIVGSFLRPSSLKVARKAHLNGEISKEELTKIEDEAILDLIEKQKSNGLTAITDGEFRRGFWHIDFIEHLNGLEGYVPEHGYNQQFKGDKAPDYNFRVIGKISFPENHPFLQHFTFLKNALGEDNLHIAKATIPSPTMILRQEILATQEHSHLKEIYPNLEDFYTDLALTYQQAIQAFYAVGCRYLQFDDTNWAFLIDKDKREMLLNKGISPDEIAEKCADIINQSLVNKPSDMTITTHICRGNHASSWIFSGGYAPIAKALFRTNYDGFFLEYDSERSGDFSPLKEWKNNQSKIVLGLVTSKFPELEDPTKIKQRIEEATQFVPLENLCLSPQCGFSSTETGNKLTEQDQWNKIKLIVEISQEVWK